MDRFSSFRRLICPKLIVKNQKVYAADVQILPPVGSIRKPVADQEPRDAGLRWSICPGDA